MYTVKKLSVDDLDEMYAFCSKNKEYYTYCPPMVTKDSLIADMQALPSGVTMEHKHYVGYYQGNSLIAILDLIEGYPDSDCAFIGFFMTGYEIHHTGIGSDIIQQLCVKLGKQGYRRIRLGWIWNNEPASRFWQKNGFIPVEETDNQNGYRVVIAEKRLDQ